MTLRVIVPRSGISFRSALPILLALMLFPLAVSAQSLSIVSGNNQTLVPNQASQALVVQARDSSGAALAGAAIAWASPNATASVVSSTKTDSGGQSSNRLTAILPGNYTVTAQLIDANGGGGASVTFSFNNGVSNLGALTPGQNAVAHAIDVACPALATSPTPITTPQSDFLNRCSEIVVGAGRAEIPTALEAMLNNKTQPQSQMSTNVQASQTANLTARMTALRSGAIGASVGGIGIISGGKALSLASLGDVFRTDPGTGSEVGSDFSRWGFFANGMITNGKFDANQSRPGFDSSGAAITAGVDYRFSDTWVGGIALGYNSDSSDLDLNAGSIDVDGFSLNGYFVWYHNDFYVQASAELNWLDFELKRNIIYQIAAIDGSGGTTSINQVAKASPGGHQEAFNLSVGRDFNNGALQVSPYLRGTWSRLNLDGFTESIDSTAPGFGLATQVDERSRTNVLGVIGGLFSYTMSQDWGVLTPNARLEYSHNFRSDPQVVVSQFVSDPTHTGIIVSDPRLDHNFYTLGFGLNGLWPQGKSGYVSYEYVSGLTGGHINRFEAGFRIEF
jgi:uncharacterized protein with beta-barrel porin domain